MPRQPVCHCEYGYGGADRASGYHRNAAGLCVPDVVYDPGT
jgi:hypothetical protein